MSSWWARRLPATRLLLALAGVVAVVALFMPLKTSEADTCPIAPVSLVRPTPKVQPGSYNWEEPADVAKRCRGAAASRVWVAAVVVAGVIGAALAWESYTRSRQPAHDPPGD